MLVEQAGNNYSYIFLDKNPQPRKVVPGTVLWQQPLKKETATLSNPYTSSVRYIDCNVVHILCHFLWITEYKWLKNDVLQVRKPKEKLSGLLGHWNKRERWIKGKG